MSRLVIVRPDQYVVDIVFLAEACGTSESFSDLVLAIGFIGRKISKILSEGFNVGENFGNLSLFLSET